MSSAKRRHPEFARQASVGMSRSTRGFLQKLCYRRAASVDMTQHGFAADSKAHPVNLLLKPLREKLEQMCGGKLGRSSSLPRRRAAESMAGRQSLQALKKQGSNKIAKTTKKRSIGGAGAKKREKGYYVCKNLNRIDSNMVVCTDSNIRQPRGVTSSKAVTAKIRRPAISFKSTLKVLKK